jgi:ribose transport system permease protein
MTVEKSRSFWQRVEEIREINVLAFVLIAGVFLFLRNPTFLSVFNVQVILRQVAVFGILGIAETFVIIALGIDLSVGSVVAFSGIMSALILNSTGSLTLTIVGVLLIGGLIGAMHGLFVTKLGVAPFIITLGSLSVFRGASFVISKGYPLLVSDDRFRWLGQGLLWRIPVPVVILIVVAIVTGFVLAYTSLGRYVYAIGGNIEAARMSGVPVRWVLMFVYIQSSLLAALVGLIIAGRLAEGLASVAVGYELTAIAGAIIGGTSFLGGVGTVRGTLLGALLMGMVDNALINQRVNAYWYNLVIGAVIVLAVTIDVLRSRGQRTA